MTAIKELPREGVYCKYELLEEAEIALPEGYELCQCAGGNVEFFHASNSCDMVTEKVGCAYVTSLVDAECATPIHTWGWGKTYDVVFNSDTDSNAKGFRSTIQECKDWIDLNRGRKETYFGDYAGGTVSIICNEDNETVYEEDIL